MDPNGGSSSAVKKQEDVDVNDSKPAPKPETKPVVRTLNRVPRACNACRKQKMRCEGAENPPCRRCRHAGLECLFEKPTREASLTGEAGLERIRSLEAHVADIRQTQTAIQATLMEIASHLRGTSHFSARSPSAYPPTFPQQSPSVGSHGSPSISTPSAAPNPPQLMVDTVHPSQSQSSNAGAVAPHGQLMNNANRQTRDQNAAMYRSPPLSSTGQRQVVTGEMHAHASASPYQQAQGHVQSGTTLPPFSSIESMGPPRSQPTNVSSMRYQAGSKRAAPPSSNVTSADSTDAEEDDGELPASGLVAPWEVLRGLADVAIERAAQENGGESEPQSRARTSSPDPRQSRPAKRRKVHHKSTRFMTFPDVVTKNIIPEAEARELFRIFYHGCSTFLPIFDANVDTFDALHERSPFAVDCICMVAAQVRDGGGNPSDIFLRCQEEVQAISCATLFSPVTRQEAVQAMILVSGWSDNGWLSGGHAVRMAMEISMHKAWPELLKRMKANKMGTTTKDRQLVISARTWFCLYLFEHQMSYGTGRPAILKDDESIWQCRLLLQHPLAIEDDMRLVSMVEIMAIRERVNNNLSPLFDRPVDDHTFSVLRQADLEFRNWYNTWDQAFSQKYEDAAFYRQSLQIQHLHAELYHNATALRGIDGLEDVQKMPPAQKELAIRSIQIGRQILEITVNSPSYREGMKYAVHYTHATATFSASFLLRLTRLFPDQSDAQHTRVLVEQLASLLAEVPGRRYALTLQLMLKRFKKRKTSSTSRSPKMTRDPIRSPSYSSTDTPMQHQINQHPPQHQPISPTYDTTSFTSHSESSMGQHSMHSVPQQHYQYAPSIDTIWRGFEAAPSGELPVWLSDQTLGGQSFSQNGIDAFLLPNDYLPPAPQIW
ncbi:Protease transcriptional activator prtT [Abortiporus biennis]